MQNLIANSDGNLPTDGSGNLSQASAPPNYRLVDGHLREIVRVVTPVFAWGTGRVSTAATGTDWVALSDTPCNDVTVSNVTGTSIAVRKVGETGDGYVIPDARSQSLPVQENANEVEIKREDNGTAQVPVSYLWYR